MALARRILRSLPGGRPPATLGLGLVLGALFWRFGPSLPSPTPPANASDPRLIRHLTATDHGPRQALLQLRHHLPLLQIRSTDIARRTAADALARQPDLAQPWVGELLTGLRCAGSLEALDALQACLLTQGSGIALRALPLALDPAPLTRERGLTLVVAVLRRHGRPPGTARDLAAGLRQALSLPDPESRRPAAEALGLLESDAADAIPNLLDALRDPAPGVRQAAAVALGRIRGPADPCVPALERILARDPDPEVRKAGAQALGRFGPRAAAAGASLAAAAEAPSTSLALAAITALGHLGPGTRDGGPALVRRLADPEPVLRAAAAAALGRLACDPSRSIPALGRAAGDPEPLVRRQAVRALGAFGPEAKSALPELIRALDDPTEPVRVEAASALGCLGPTAAGAIPALHAARNNNQSVMSQPVLAALDRISGTTDPPPGSWDPPRP